MEIEYGVSCVKSVRSFSAVMRFFSNFVSAKDINPTIGVMLKNLNILFVFLSFCMVSLLADGAENVYALSGLSTDSLVRKGQIEVERLNHDRALVCFTIAAKRYSEGLDDEEKYQTMIANIGKWYIYFFEYYDHVNAFKSLSAAHEISKELGRSDSRIMLDYGCMYQTLSEQSGDPRLLEQALEYYTKAFKIGLDKDSSLATVNMAFTNLVQINASLDRVEPLAPLYESFIRANRKKRTVSPSYSFDSIFYGAILKMHRKDFNGAIAELDGRQMNSVISSPGMGRYDIVRLINLAKSYIGRGDGFAKAIECMLKAEAIADSVGMKDARLEVYKYIRDVYAQYGEKEKSLEYQYKYLSLKDSVLNYRSGAAISELTYLKKVAAVEKDLDKIENKRKFQAGIIWIAVAIILVSAVSILLLRRHNRRLRILNETLYRNNILLIEKEETTRKELEEAVRQKTASGGKPRSESGSSKYRNSDLTDAEKDDIYLSVMNVLLNSPEVFKPDFSSASLSELTGYTYRHISQVINERTGDNFNALVNDTRIKEACRGMQPGGRFSNLTIEAIGNSVGFRSRTSFIAAFKKFTGLTPSVYQKVAAHDESAKTAGL